MLAGFLSPPYFLSKKAYKHYKKQNSSKTKRVLATVGAASLGVIGLPVLSIWGLCKTWKNVGMTTARTMLDWLDQPEPEKELPDQYNEKRKTNNQKATTSKDAESSTDTDTASRSTQQENPAADDTEHGNEGERDFGVCNEQQEDTLTELSVRKPKKRKFSEISRTDRPRQMPLMVMPKESATYQESEIWSKNSNLLSENKRKQDLEILRFYL